MAAVSVVFPWSTCPIVPMFIWGLVLENTFLASAAKFLLMRGTEHLKKKKKKTITTETEQH